MNTKDLKEWCMEPIDWILSSQTYADNMIDKFELLMADGRPQYCFKEYKTPMDKEYHPELDESPLLNAELHSRYRSMVGSLNWLITIGRFDVQFAVTALARYSHAPRAGHLNALLRVMGYIKKFKKAKILVDPTLPNHEAYPYVDLNNGMICILMLILRYQRMHYHLKVNLLGLPYGSMQIMLEIK